MIQQHPDIPFPEDETQSIWRFTDFTTFVQLLETSRLPFHRLDRPGGGGAVAGQDAEPARQITASLARAAGRGRPAARGKLERWWAEKARENEVERAIQSIRTIRMPETLWIDRWHVGDADDAILWRLNGGAEVLALRSSIAALRDALVPANGYSVSIGLVQYVDGAPPTDGPAAALVQQRVFDFERELRAVAAIQDAEVAEDPAVLGVEAPAVSLVHAIHLSPSASPAFADLVQRLTRRYGLDVPCSTSALGAAPDTRLPALVSSA